MENKFHSWLLGGRAQRSDSLKQLALGLQLADQIISIPGDTAGNVQLSQGKQSYFPMIIYLCTQCSWRTAIQQFRLTVNGLMIKCMRHALVVKHL